MHIRQRGEFFYSKISLKVIKFDAAITVKLLAKILGVLHIINIEIYYY